MSFFFADAVQPRAERDVLQQAGQPDVAEQDLVGVEAVARFADLGQPHPVADHGAFVAAGIFDPTGRQHVGRAGKNRLQETRPCALLSDVQKQLPHEYSLFGHPSRRLPDAKRNCQVGHP